MVFRYLGPGVLAVWLFPALCAAQAYNVPTPAPTVSAVGHEWFDNRIPILYAGDRYYPAGPRYHFDPGVMVPAGTFDGVPVYVDTSVEAYSQLLVPVGGGLVQPYERRRSGQLAGTTGSHAPEFPVDVLPWEAPGAQGWPAQPAPARGGWRGEEGPGVPSRGWSAEEEQARLRLLQPPGHIETVRGPENNRGIWIRYENVRWEISGKAVPFETGRFSKIGEYFGFPVYAARGSEEIFIPAAEGMLAAYHKAPTSF